MNGPELVRIIDTLHRDKAIEKDILFSGIESALVSAVKKQRDSAEEDEIVIVIDRKTGEVSATENGEPIDLDMGTLGRIAAQAAKQVMIQKIREGERDVIFDDYEGRKGTLVTGSVQRFEGPNIIVNLGRTEGYLPKSDQMPDDNYKIGERIRAFIYDVKKVGQRVKILLSRTHKDLVRRLFEVEVPEINEKIIEVKALAREAGYRTKIAVESHDQKVDCVGACVGVRGSRIRNIVEELNGEKIDIIRWNDLDEILIANALKPAEVTSIELDPETLGATVVVDKEQLSLAIGRRGQNVRLAAKLSGWNIDIVTESEERERTSVLLENLMTVPGVEPETAQKIVDLGYASIDEILFRGAEALTEVPDVSEEQAAEVIAYIGENRDKFAAAPAPVRKSGGGKPHDPLAAAAEKMLAEEMAQSAAEEDVEPDTAEVASEEPPKDEVAGEEPPVDETDGEPNNVHEKELNEAPEG